MPLSTGQSPQESVVPHIMKAPSRISSVVLLGTMLLSAQEVCTLDAQDVLPFVHCVMVDTGQLQS